MINEQDLMVSLVLNGYLENMPYVRFGLKFNILF